MQTFIALVLLSIISGIARPSGLGGHTYRWISAARLGQDQKKKVTTFQAEDASLQREHRTSKLSPVCLLYTTAIESRHRYFLKLGGHMPTLGYATEYKLPVQFYLGYLDIIQSSCGYRCKKITRRKHPDHLVDSCKLQSVNWMATVLRL